MTASSTNDTRRLRVVDIVEGTSVDGPGLRTSVYLAGCDHRCPGCHNPQTWPHDAGFDMTIAEIMEVVRRSGFNVTLSGGDPMYQPDGVDALLDALRAEDYKVWCYTGFTYEQLAADKKRSHLLEKIDVLVDGPFIESLRDISLRFRGSSNQRLIDLRRSTPGNVALWND